ncbi:MAG TPA: protease pro-enzyme activation domain-containing protein [Bryobacteraceae bacterium]|nr:protease pro-enzyme activation domain-containing protein [Bryobacteraceae bacterium]
MIRKFSTSLLTIAALVPVVGIAGRAASLPPLTRNISDAVVNGQAKVVGHMPANQSMRIVFVLPLRNQPAMTSLLQSLYDPTSPSFHKFLTVEQFTDQFGPTQADYDALVSFVQNKGLQVAATSRNRLNLDVTGSVASIESALHVTMNVYQHPTESRTFFSPDREPTPDLSIPLWRIAGLDNYDIPQPALVKRPDNAQPAATTGSCPSASFCGSDMRAAYYGNGPLTGAGQSLGLLEYYGTDLADLTTYFTNAHQTNNVPVTLVSTDGTSTSCVYPSCDDTEQTLDMTQAIGMAPGLAHLIMYVGSTDSAILNGMATGSPLCAQLSASWTWRPADPTTDDPYFQEFAMQGQNYFNAAGDSAKWGKRSEIWPSDDEYVTSVGGTDLSTASAGGPWASETAWADGGGGISPNSVAIPSWQVATAAGCSNCSQTLRNGPDVSANSNYTFYVCADQTTCTANEYGGTSFATPMWAGYLALANQQSVANSGTTLGFINPTLYTTGLGSSYTTNFHDITSGSNGYSATVGYDLATGWGSPNGSALITTLVGGSTPPGFSISASPSTVSIARGQSGTSTITSTVTGGFSSAIALTASGQPSGVTVSFNPTSITGAGTSTMTIAVGSSAAAGSYTITVTGKSGSIVETTTVALTVTSPNFKITANPTTLNVPRGTSATTTLTTQVGNGFNSQIGLSVSGQEANISITFGTNPIPAPGSGTSIMTVRVSKAAVTGTNTLTITAKGGGITHTTTVTLNIQ